MAKPWAGYTWISALLGNEDLAVVKEVAEWLWIWFDAC
jgi:hypothetical protein